LSIGGPPDTPGQPSRLPWHLPCVSLASQSESIGPLRCPPLQSLRPRWGRRGRRGWSALARSVNGGYDIRWRAGPDNIGIVHVNPRHRSHSSSRSGPIRRVHHRGWRDRYQTLSIATVAPRAQARRRRIHRNAAGISGSGAAADGSLVMSRILLGAFHVGQRVFGFPEMVAMAYHIRQGHRSPAPFFGSSLCFPRPVHPQQPRQRPSAAPTPSVWHFGNSSFSLSR